MSSRMYQETVQYQPPMHGNDHARWTLLANRYWLGPHKAAGEEEEEEAVTLIFLHSTSFHKETWEPCIERLLTHGEKQSVKIREAWSFECPNHGASAVYNAATISQPNIVNSFTCEKYAQHAQTFFSSGPVDFSKRKLVGVGHSLGSVAMTLLSTSSLPFISIHLVEPVLTPLPPSHLAFLRQALVKTAYERRDVFSTRRDAELYLRGRDRVSSWDGRVFDCYIKHAFIPHPGSKFADAPYEGVTLACTREQEATMYRDYHGPHDPVPHLVDVAKKIPVYVIYGEHDDFLPRYTQDALTNVVSFRSITRVRDAGHLVPQDQPDKVADIILAQLASLSTDGPPRLLRARM